MNGERFLANGDVRRLEVHDLDHEDAQCRIDDILRAGDEGPYHTLVAARADGYGTCPHCVVDASRSGGGWQ